MKRAKRHCARAEQLDRPAVDFKGGARAEPLAGIAVDRIDDPDRGRVIGVLQFEHRAQLVRRAGDLVLDDRAVGDAARGRHALGERLALAAASKPVTETAPCAVA